MNTDSKDQLKAQLEGKRIKSINFANSLSENILVIDIDLDSGDKLVFGNNDAGLIICLKKAKDIEMQIIKDQISRLQLESASDIEIRHINRDNLESLAREKAKELGHPNPFNTVFVDGSKFKIDFRTND